MTLEEVRKEIDEIDGQLNALFLRRMALAKDAFFQKKQLGKPISDRTREREILKSVTEKSGDMAPYARRFFKELLSVSRSYQSAVSEGESGIFREMKALALQRESFPKSARLACQGIEGAYSQQAADKLFPHGDLHFYDSFEEVCTAVKQGVCDYGILPIENSSNGSVHAVYALLQGGGLSIVRSLKLCIRHELLAKPGTSLENVREIISHEQALGQCRGFLKALEGVKISTCANTALAAKAAAEQDGVAAISAHNCAELYGLEPVVRQSIQDSDNNYTRFICISAKPEIYPGARRISFLASTKHEPGAFSRLISVIGARDVNILKVESKPIIGRDFEFMFFFDVEADILDEGVIGMLEEISGNSESFVFLGNYQEL